MKYLLQIGRLDANLSSIYFQIENHHYTAELSCFALKEHFGNEAKAILIYPVSLPFNKRLIEAKGIDESLRGKIKQAIENPEAYFKDPYYFFLHHPHTKKADDFIVIHSIGEFESQKFEATFNCLVLELLIKIIEKYYHEKFSELYVDISSGHNIYISALLEAIRHFAVFQRLQSWNASEVKVFLVFSDPIIGSSKTSYRIYKDYEIKFKTFFSSPVSPADIRDFKLARAVAKEDRQLKQENQQALEKFSIAFSALKNNTPLVLYSFEFDTPDSIDELIKKVIDSAQRKISSDWRIADIEKNDYVKLLLSLSFYKGIVSVLGQHEIIKKNCVCFDEIKDKFESIYKIFELDLNKEILGHEIRNLKEGKDKEGKTLSERASSDWRKLSEYLYGEDDTVKKRNFLAHAGFERNTILVKKDERLYVRYEESYLEKIKKFLIESI